jgi:transcriptional regulator with XRE-family HTH domain
MMLHFIELFLTFFLVARFGKEAKRERLLEILQLLKLQWINRSDVATEIGVSRSTISRYCAEITENSPSQKRYQALIDKITDATKFRGILGRKVEGEREGYESLKEHLNHVIRRLDAIERSNRRIEKALKIDPPGGESPEERIP